MITNDHRIHRPQQQQFQLQWRNLKMKPCLTLLRLGFLENSVTGGVHFDLTLLLSSEQ